MIVTNRDYYFMSRDEFAAAKLGPPDRLQFLLEPVRSQHRRPRSRSRHFTHRNATAPIAVLLVLARRSPDRRRGRFCRGRSGRPSGWRKTAIW